VKLHFCKDTDLIWKRVKRGDGFGFVNSEGSSVSDGARARFLSLKIPPKWKDVTLSPDPHSHIQAIGIDAKGRKQYIYHPLVVKHNQKHKFDQLITFGKSLPNLRDVVRGHIKIHKLTRDRILATIVWLLDNTFIRVGNKIYADENESYGLTTLRGKHVSVRGDKVRFSFKGKSGIFHELGVTNSRIADTIRECIDLPGYEIFHYMNEDGDKRIIDSSDVNEYLQKYAGEDFSAKDFRTWGGSVLAGDLFYKIGEAKDTNDFKKNTNKVVDGVSEHLGNTKAICRRYYIHPTVIKSYEKKVLVPHFAHSYARLSNKKISLSKEEYATWSLIKDF
jgi:DNA topoisomerase I